MRYCLEGSAKGDRHGGHAMRLMFDVTDPDERKHTMTEQKGKAEGIDVKAVLAGDEAFLRTIVKTALQEFLKTEMREAVGAGKGERCLTGVEFVVADDHAGLKAAIHEVPPEAA